MPRVKPVAFAALSAVLFAAALPNEGANYGVPALGLVALIPLYAALREANEMRVALWVGGVYGALSTVLSNYWLANFGEFAVWTLGGPTVAYARYTTCCSLRCCIRSCACRIGCGRRRSQPRGRGTNC